MSLSGIVALGDFQSWTGNDEHNSVSGHRMRLLILYSGLILAFLLPVAVLADSIQVLELKNKPATDVIPLIEPLLQKNDAVTGTGYQLILRTDQATLGQIKALLDKIDTRPRNLLITVRNNTQQSRSHRGIDASGQVIIGDHDRADVNIRSTDRRNTRDSDVLQSITVLEGQRATIGSGQSIPYRSQQVYRNGRWVTVYENVEFEDVGNSVYVVPTVQGERVRLSIEPEYSSFDRRSGDIQYQSLDTVIVGKLGEWISLGIIDEDIQSSRNGIVSTHRSRKNTYANIEVKVEIKE